MYRLGFNQHEAKCVGILSIVFIFRMLGLFIILPVLSNYAHMYKYATKELIGLALGIYGLSQACMQIPFGIVSDFLGRKKTILIGILLLIAGSTLTILAQNIYTLILGRALQGMGAIGSVVMAAASDATRDSVRTKALALIGVNVGIAFMISLIIGPLCASLFGIKGVFIFTLILSILSLIIISFYPEVKIFRKFSVKNFFSNTVKIFSYHETFLLNSAVFVIHLSLIAVFLVVPEYIAKGAQNGTILSRYYAFTLILSLPIVGIVMKYFSHNVKKMHISMIIMMCVSFAIILISKDSRILFSLGLLLFFASFCTLEASLPSTLSKLASPSVRGVTLGIFATNQYFGTFIGGTVGGLIFQNYSADTVIFSCFALCIVWVGFAMLNLVSSKSNILMTEI